MIDKDKGWYSDEDLLEITEFGFHWRDVSVTRVYHRNGYIVINVRSKRKFKDSIDIYVSPAGKIKVFKEIIIKRNGKVLRRYSEEMKVIKK